MESNGTSLSSLAERIREKTERDAREIESLTRKQFDSLSRSLAESSQNALSITEGVIRNSIAELEKNITSRFLRLGDIFSRKCLCAMLLSGGILAATMLTCWGLITLYHHQITDLRREAAELKEEKAAWDRDFPPLQRAFPGLTLHKQDGRNYLILPEGMTARDGGVLEKREAWEIVRK